MARLTTRGDVRRSDLARASSVCATFVADAAMNHAAFMVSRGAISVSIPDSAFESCASSAR